MLEQQIKTKTCKILLGGDGFVGKTTMCKRLEGNLNSRKPTHFTCGIDLHHMKVLNEGLTCATLYDLGGQERFRIFQKTFFTNAEIIILVFSFDLYISFSNLDEWLSFISNSNSKEIFLVGNKLDVSEKCIETRVAQKFAEDHGMRYFETSALKGTNFESFRKALIQTIIKITE